MGGREGGRGFFSLSPSLSFRSLCFVVAGAPVPFPWPSVRWREARPWGRRRRRRCAHRECRCGDPPRRESGARGWGTCRSSTGSGWGRAKGETQAARAHPRRSPRLKTDNRKNKRSAAWGAAVSHCQGGPRGGRPAYTRAPHPQIFFSRPRCRACPPHTPAATGRGVAICVLPPPPPLCSRASVGQAAPSPADQICPHPAHPLERAGGAEAKPPPPRRRAGGGNKRPSRLGSATARRRRAAVRSPSGGGLWTGPARTVPPESRRVMRATAASRDFFSLSQHRKRGVVWWRAHVLVVAWLFARAGALPGS